MNSMYGSDDLFENGWANDDAQPQNSVQFPLSSYLTSLQLLLAHESAPTTVDVSGHIPDQYRAIFEKLRPDVASATGLETNLFQPLVDHHLISTHQVSRIIDTVYDHNLLPGTHENNFFQIMGLLALELDVPGSGDYVTLQFRFNTGLPQLPGAAAAILLQDTEPEPQTSAPEDPLTAQLASTSLENENEDWNSEGLLADHLALLIDPDTTSPESVHVNDFPYLRKYVENVRDQFKPTLGDNSDIKIKEVPEKEGLLFKHINYTILHELNLGMHGPAGVKKVVRRYLDFVWLLEFLLKKYPFRVIPGLPPKKFSGASPDSQFLQRRRRGLHRFLNQLVKHPVLRLEPIVVTFLSVPTDLTSWRKQARIDYSLEFKGQKILTTFINLIWPSVGAEFLKNWKAAEENVPKLIDTWTKMVMLVERHEKRQQQIACDNSKFVEMLTRFVLLDEAIYPHKEPDNKVIATLNKDDTGSINESLGNIAGFFNKTSTLLVDESYVVNTAILEKFKNFLDYLYLLQELFERAKRLSVNSIPQLLQKIQDNERKYESLSKDDVDIKGSELVKLRQAIINDKQEMFQQLNKDWLIKSCCFDELVMFQETQFLVSEAWADWCRGRYKFQEKFTSLYDNLNNEVVPDMPLGR